MLTDLSNKMLCELATVEEEQGNAVLSFHFTVKAFNQLYIINKTELVLKVGVSCN